MIRAATPTDRIGHMRLRDGVGARLLNLFSNVWFGVFWAALLFLYCSIGSAIPHLRRQPWLEMTEFEWFHWWPFNFLVAIFCTALVTTTIRRIPLRWVNAGVWTIHTGIITLCLGSYYYFITKVEGDAPVFRRQVKIELPGLPTPATLLAVSGSETSVSAGADLWRFQIESTNTAWPILSDENKGQNAYAVNVFVRPPDGEPFVRQLLAGFPQYTEDVIPGKGRAIKSIGRKLLDETLKLSLDYEPQESFHVMDTWALFVRPSGAKDWNERRIDGLPRYNERIATREHVFTDPHDPLPLRPLDLPVPPAASADPLSAASVRVTGYLPYAHMERRWKTGGDRLNPVLQLGIIAEESRDQSYELIAFDPQHSQAADGNVQFVWLADSTQVKSLPVDSRAMLRISVPDANVSLDVPFTPQTIGGPLTPVPGTEFAYRVLDVHDNLALPGKDRGVSVAVVEIQTPTGTFRRWVADSPEHSRDLPAEGADPHASAPPTPDPRLQMSYQPRTPPLIFAAHPGGLHFVFNGPNGRVIGREVRSGESIEILPAISVRVDSYWASAVAEVKPVVVPMMSRRRDAGESFAMIRLEVDTGQGLQTKWLAFNSYAFPNEQYAYGGRFSFTPERFRTTDGSSVEVLFSRQRMKLPHPVTMEDFELDTHVGGYSGSASTIRNYVSRLRFFDQGQWTEPVAIAVNHPTQYGGFWYFQSSWDRPPQPDSTDGMNYTGLGIGNRHGVHIQLAGCSIAVTGMIFAFYIKPVLKRRRFEQSRARAGISLDDTDDEPATAMAATG